MKNKLRRVVAWVLIIVMLMPNFAFAATLDQGTVTINGLLPNGESAAGLLNLEVSFYDPAGGSLIKTYDLTGTGSIVLDNSNTTELGDQIYQVELTSTDDDGFYLASERQTIDFASITSNVTVDLSLKGLAKFDVKDDLNQELESLQYAYLADNGNELNISLENGSARIISAPADTYRIRFFSNGNDLLAPSAVYNLVVDQDSNASLDGVPIVGSVVVDLQLGVDVGTAYIDEVASNQGGVDITKNGSHQLWISPKENGKVILPKVDALYELRYSLGSDQEENYVAEVENIEISGNNIVSMRNYSLFTKQMEGTITKADGSPLTDDNLYVWVQDQGAGIPCNVELYSNNGDLTYKLGGAYEGAYDIFVFVPSDYSDNTQTSSEKIAINIDSNLVSDQPVLNLQLTEKPVVTFAIDTNYVENYRANSDNLHVDLKLEGTSSTSKSDYSLVIKDGENIVHEVTDYYWTDIFTENELVRFRADIDLGGTRLQPGSYTLEVTYDSNVVSAAYNITDQPFIEGMSYFGEDDTNHYFKVHVSNLSGDNITVKDDNGEVITDAALNIFYADHNSYYLQLPMTDTPATYNVDGVVWMNQYTNEVHIDPDTTNAEIRVDTTDVGTEIKFYNSNIEVVNLTSVVVHMNNNNVNFLEENSTVVEAFTGDLTGGIKVTIPRNNAYDDGRYSISWTINGQDGSSGDYQFIFKSPLMTFNVINSNDEAATNYRFSRNHKTDGAELHTSNEDDKIYVSPSSNNGEYSLVVSSGEGTDSFSEEFDFKIEGDVPKLMDGTEITGTQTIKIRAGILAGYALNPNGSPTQEAEVRYFEHVSGDDYNWISNAEPRADGSFYVPVHDASYRIGLESYNPDYSYVEKDFQASGGAVNVQDLQLNQVLLKGWILDPSGSNVYDGGYNIEMLNEASEHQDVDRYDDDGRQAYKVGNLAPGKYYITLFPEDYYTGEGYAFSETYEVTIADTLITQDLQFREASNIPLSIKHNDIQVMASNDDFFMVRVGLLGTSDTDSSHYSFKIINKNDNTDEYVVDDYHWINVRDKGGFIQIDSDFRLNGYQFSPGDYELEITHDGQTVAVDVSVTNSPVVEGSMYLGSRNDTHYAKLHVNNFPSNEILTATIFDDQGNNIGEGTAFMFTDEQSPEPILEYTYAGTAAYFEIDGVEYTNQHANQLPNDLDGYESMITVQNRNDGNYIRIYNGNILTEYVTSVRIDIGGYVEFLGETNVTKTVFNDSLSGGIEVFIPYNNSYDNGHYRVEWTIDGNLSDSGDYEFIFKAPIYVFAIQDSLGNDLSDFRVSASNQSPGADIRYSENASKLFLNADTVNGDYAFAVSPSTGTESISEMFKFTVTDGVAYYRAEDGGGELEADIALQSREGVLAGFARDISGQATTDGYINLHYNNGNGYDWIGQMELHSDGSFYLPTIDGTYEVGLHVHNDAFTIYREVKEYTIENGTLDAEQDLQFAPVQLRGTLRDPSGNPLNERSFGVDLRDEQGQQFELDEFEIDGDYVYVTGRLPNGTYNITLYPHDYYRDMGYFSSTTDTIVIDGGDIIDHDLRFRTADDIPFSLSENLAKVVPSNVDYFIVDVLLNGTAEQDINQYTLQLKDSSNQTIDLVDDHWNELYEEDGRLRLRGNMSLENYLSEGDYTLLITYNSTTIEMPVELTDSPIVASTNYIGTDGIKHYLALELWNNDGQDMAVTVYNSNDQEIGSGVAKVLYQPHGNYYVEYTATDTPDHFSIDGTKYYNDYSSGTDQSSDVHEAVTTVEAGDDGMYVRLYNGHLAGEDLTSFKIYFGEGEVEFVNRPGTVVTEFDDLSGGVQIFIPFDEDLESGYFRLMYDFGYFSGDRGDYYFNFAAPLISFNIEDSQGNPADVFYSILDHLSDGAEIKYAKNGSILNITKDSTDGNYSIVILPGGGTDSYGEKYFFSINGGVPYDSEGNEITTNVTLSSSSGVLGGYVLNPNGSVPSDAYVKVYKFINDNDTEWESSLILNADGSFYLPSVDGRYEVQAKPYSSNPELSPTSDIIIISGGIVEAQKDLTLSYTQLMGNILDPSGEFLSNGGFDVKIVDSENNELSADTNYLDDKQYYRIGSLAQGTYEIVLLPHDDYQNMGYTDSETLSFTIDAEGNASPENLNLQFRLVDDLTKLKVNLLQEDGITPYDDHVDIINYGDDIEYGFSRVNDILHFTTLNDGHYEFSIFNMNRETDELTAADRFIVDVENGVVSIDDLPATEIALTMANRPLQVAALGLDLQGSEVSNQEFGTLIMKANGEKRGSNHYENLNGYDGIYMLEPGDYSIRLMSFDTTYSNSNIVLFTVNPDGSSTLVDKMLELQFKESVIRGRVIMSDGSPLPEDAYLRARLYVDGETTGDGTNYRYTSVDVDGNFSFNVPAGTHTIVINSYNDKYMELSPVEVIYDGQTPVLDVEIKVDEVYPSLVQLRTEAHLIVTDGFITESVTAFDTALVDADTVTQETEPTEIKDMHDVLKEALNGLTLINPTMAASTTELTNQDVVITVSKNFETTDMNYQTVYKIDDQWIEFTDTITVANNATVLVKTVYDNGVLSLDSNEVTLDITNIDKEKPMLSLEGDRVIVMRYGTVYSDGGYLVSDNITVLGKIAISEEDNISNQVLGDYTYKYTATDEAGNSAVKTRIIRVIDDVDPTISVTNGAGDTLADAIDVIGSHIIFKIDALDEFDTNADITVKVNGNTVQATNDVYTVEMQSGDNFIVAKIVDASGNTAISIVTVTNHDIDIEASNELTNSEVEITATVPEVSNALISDSGSQTASDNGFYEFTANVVGLTTSSKAYVYEVDNIDTDAPVEPSIEAQETYLTNEGTFLTMTGEENLWYQINSGEWTAYTGSIFLTTEDTTVSIKATDAAGNETAGDSIVVDWIDTSKPTVSSELVLKLNGNEYNNEFVVVGDTVTLEMTVTDNHENLTVYTRCNDEETVVSSATSDVPFIYTLALPDLSNANNQIQIWAYDEAGNRLDFGTDEYVKTINNIKIDTHAPIMTMNGGDAIVMLAGVYQDPGVIVNDDLDSDPNVITNGSVNVNAVAVYTITYQASDAAGNTSSELTRTVEVVDTLNPMLTTDLENKTVSRAAFSFTAVAEDNDSMSSWLVKHNNNTVTGTDDVYSVELAEGANTIVLQGEDPSGNISEETFTVTFVKPASDKPYMIQDITVPTNETITVEIGYPDGAFEKKYALSDTAGITDRSAITVWLDYSTAIELTDNKVVYAYSQQDNDSLPSEMVALVVDNYDATAPVAPVLTASTTEPTNEAVNITINAEGTIYYQLGQVLNGNESLVNLSVYESTIALTSNDTIYTFSVDEANNRSDVASFEVTNIDKVAPIGEVAYSTKTSTSSDVIVTLIVNEDYIIDQDGPRYKTFTTNGNYVFNFKDLAGNAGTVTANVDNIDRNDPVVMSSSVTVNNQEVEVVKGGDLLKITYVVTDDEMVSGTVDLGHLVLGTPFRVTYNSTNDTYELQANIQVPDDFNGDISVNACIKDMANNKLTLVVQDTLTIDNVKPVFNVRFTNEMRNGYIVDDAIETLVTKDDSTIKFGFSLATMTQDISSLNTVLNSTYEDDLGHLNYVYEDGLEHTIYMQGIDEAGNLSEPQTLTFKWDAHAPVAPNVTTDVTSPTNSKDVTVSGFAEVGSVRIMRGPELIFEGSTSTFVSGVNVTLRPGTNTFTVTNTDLAGNTSSAKTMTIELDIEAPVVDVILAENHVSYADGTIIITSDEALTNATYTLDGGDPQSIDMTDREATVPAITDDGEHFLLITGYDAAGNTGVGRLSFVTVAEVAGEQELSEGISMNSGSFSESGQMVVRTFEVDAGDDQGFVGEAINFELEEGVTVGVGGVVVDVYVGLGFPANTKLNYYKEDTNEWLPLDADIENGDSYYNGTNEVKYVKIDATNAVAITVLGANEPGAIAVESGHIIGLLRHFSGYAAIEDIVAPELTVTTTEPTEPTKSDTYGISVNVTELSTVVVTDGSDNELISHQFGPGTHVFTMDLEDVDAAYVFKFVATDEAGLTSPVQTFAVARDSQAPEVTSSITGVRDGGSVSKNDSSIVGELVVTDANLDVDATVTDTNFEEIKVNDTVFNTTTVNTSITLNEGTNNLQIISTDTAGNSTTRDYTIELDTQGPEVVINGIQEGDVLGGNISATITGTDLVSYTATLTSTSVNETFNGEITYTVANGSKDQYNLTVDGYDENGNSTRVSIDFTVDQSAPSIVFADVDNMSNNTQSVEVTVSPKESDTEIKIYKNNKRMTSITPTSSEVGETMVYAFDVTESGSYRVEVNAINQSSASNKTLSFSIDKDDPTINVSGVEDAGVYTAYPTITFTSSDTVEAKLNDNVIGSGYKVSTNGDYTLLLTATDAAGNETIESLTFTVNVSTNTNTGDDNSNNDSSGGSPGGSTGGATKPSTPDSDLDEDDQKKLDEVEDQLPQAGEDATDAQKEAAKSAVDELLNGMDLDSAKDADAQVKAVASTVGKTLEVLDGEKAAEVAEDFADLVGAALENPNVSVEEQQEMMEDAIENTFSKLTANEDASDADLLGVKDEIANLVETVVKNAATLEVVESTTPQAGEDAVEGLKAFELTAKDLASTLKTAVATQADLVKSLEANGLSDVAKTVEKNIKLALPEVKAMEQVSLKLDAEAAKSLGDSGVGMTVEAKGINFKLPAALMQAAKSGLSVASKPVTRADNLNQVTDAGKVSNLKTVNVSVENGNETVKGMVELSFSLADLKDVDLDALAVGVFEDGQWTKLDFTIENGQVTFTAPHFSIYSLMTFTPSFEDVDTSWAKKYITSLTARGVVSGKSTTAYDPNGTLTRAEFTTMLVKHLGLTNEVTQNFKDVSSDEWYYTYIGQAGLNGLAVGVESGNFMPNEPITREDIAVMMYRAYKLKNGFNLDNATTPFVDNSKISESARKAVYAVRTNGIISGYPDNTFRPEANATRAEAAAMMYLFLNK